MVLQCLDLFVVVYIQGLFVQLGLGMLPREVLEQLLLGG